MALILAFGVALLVSASLSGVAARTALSGVLLFLMAGAMIDQVGFGSVRIAPHDPPVTAFADITLSTLLFTEGQRTSLPVPRERWRLAGRALGLGMPLTMIGIAVPAHFLGDVSWPAAFLLRAVLSPTDPVLTAVIVRQPLPGNPRTCVSEAPARNHPPERSRHTNLIQCR